MLTAKLVVEAILDGKVGKAAIRAVSVDDDYHEKDNPNVWRCIRARRSFAGHAVEGRCCQNRRKRALFCQSAK
jgi:hypothetical protein